MEYVSLHHHSTFSYGDGYQLPAEHVEFCANAGMKAMALTEHGNTSSHVQLDKACKKHGLKPLFGLEAYIAPPKEMRKFHQTIIAINQTGLVNLYKLVTQSYKDFYKYPTIHLHRLAEFSEGLVVLSGCADSALSCTLLGGKSFGDKRERYTAEQYSNTVNLALWYKDVFGPRYFLECQRFEGLGRTRTLNPAFQQISRDTGIPAVITSDCHYIYPRDNTMQQILHAAHRGSTVDAVAASWEYDILLSIPPTDDEVLGNAIGTGLDKAFAVKAIENTGLIADMANVKLEQVETIKYPISEKDHESWV